MEINLLWEYVNIEDQDQPETLCKTHILKGIHLKGNGCTVGRQLSLPPFLLGCSLGSKFFLFRVDLLVRQCLLRRVCPNTLGK